MWERAVEAARSRSLPIVFHDVALGKLQAVIAGLVGDAGAFYIGATVDPAWRWLGGNSDRGTVEGHGDVWDELRVLYFGQGREHRTWRRGSSNMFKSSTCLVGATTRPPDNRGQVRGVPNRFLFGVALR